MNVIETNKYSCFCMTARAHRTCTVEGKWQDKEWTDYSECIVQEEIPVDVSAIFSFIVANNLFHQNKACQVIDVLYVSILRLPCTVGPQ